MRVLSLVLLLLISTQVLAQERPHTPAPTSKALDSAREEWIDVSREPIPVMPIEHLIVYPDSARRAKLEGTVEVAALLDTNGAVLKVEILHATNAMFASAAGAAMAREKFSPALNQFNRPVSLWINRRINFVLKDTLTSQYVSQGLALPVMVPRIVPLPRHEGVVEPASSGVLGASLDSVEHLFAVIGDPEITHSGDSLIADFHATYHILDKPDEARASLVRGRVVQLTLTYSSISDHEYERLASRYFPDAVDAVHRTLELTDGTLRVDGEKALHHVVLTMAAKP